MSGIKLSIEDFRAIKQRLEFRYIGAPRAISWKNWLKNHAQIPPTPEEGHVARKLLADEGSMADMGEQFARLHGLNIRKAPEIMQVFYDLALDPNVDSKTRLNAAKEVQNRTIGRAPSARNKGKIAPGSFIRPKIGELIAEDKEVTRVIDVRSASVKKRKPSVPADGGTETVPSVGQ